MDFRGIASCADLVHQDCRATQVPFVRAEVARIHLLIRPPGPQSRVRWHLDNDIQARWVNQTALSVVRYLDRSAQLARLDPKQVDFSFVRRDEDVIFARVDIESGNFAVVDVKLRYWRDCEPIIPDLDELESDAVWRTHGEDMELSDIVLVHACEGILEQMARFIARVLLCPLDNPRHAVRALVEPRNVLLDVA